MQTILGAGGSVGSELAKELKHYTEKIRLVARNPQKVNESDELFKCDLVNPDQVKNAVKGSEVVYLVAGLPYRYKIWKEQWPLVMRNVLDACKVFKSKLVFLDNIYLLDPGEMGFITEKSTVAPSSKKGNVRKEIAEMILREAEAGMIDAIIARAPDFYGPAIQNGALNMAVLKPMIKGKKANWFCSIDNIHTFMWTPDGAKGLAILGNDKSAYGQIWHLPTSSEQWTIRQFINAIAEYLDVEPRVQVAGRALTRILGLFDPTMREFVEMLYQYDRDYIFDSTKFEQQYNIQPTQVKEAIRLMVDAEISL
jgi:nucleoside-diphosphate-sugar epimerase